ncbi:MAG: shikimate kinase AroK [Gemmatimonadales bacterium]|nr:MAG: shikimate kinase AroK [Gemmatimonadales bacterium]
MGRCPGVVNTGRRHIVLVGPPGSGKSEAGRLLALELETALTDVDEVIVREEGATIAQIFEVEGEAVFRAKEQRAVTQALAAPAHVVVPGGGWAAQPGAMVSARRAYRIHLRTSAESAATRLTHDHSRPLLREGRLERLRALIDERLPYYELADQDVETDGRSIAGVVSVLAELALGEGGWG